MELKKNGAIRAVGNTTRYICIHIRYPCKPSYNP